MFFSISDLVYFLCNLLEAVYVLLSIIKQSY